MTLRTKLGECQPTAVAHGDWQSAPKSRGFAASIDALLLWNSSERVAQSFVLAAKGRRGLALENLALRHQGCDGVHSARLRRPQPMAT